MPLITSPDISAAVESTHIPLTRIVLTMTLPAGPYSDFSNVVESVSWDTQPGPNLPDGIPDEDGESATSGSLVLFGKVDETDSRKNVAWLLNPQDSTSPMFRRQVKGSLVTLDIGVEVPDGDGNLVEVLVRQFTMRVSAVDSLDHAAGTAALSLVDQADDWGDLPAMPAVIVDEPFNAGLTSEYVLDRIARTASDGDISSWPATRPSAIFAAGLRSSIWPEVGTIDFSVQSPLVTFGRGPFGTGVADTGKVVNTINPIPQFVELGSAASNDQHLEFLFVGLGQSGTSDALTLGVGVPHSPIAGIWNIAGLLLQVEYNQITVLDAGADIWTVAVDDGIHHVILDATRSGGNWTGAVRLASYDGTTWTSTTHSFSGVAATDPTTFTSAGYTVAGKGGVMAAPQVSNETAPAYVPFYPQAIIDQSLNPLQAVPAIDSGTDAWDEIQTVVLAECGYAYRDNLGRFVFLNRDTVMGQSPWREIRSDTSLETITSNIPASTQYQAVKVDYTDWTYKPAATVFSPVGPPLVKAHETKTWQRTLPDGAAVALVDGTGQILPDGHPAGPTNGGTYYRAALDKFGNGVGSLQYLKVVADTPSTITITAKNNTGNNVWLVTNDTYTDVPAGTVALWVGGTPVVPDGPNVVTVATSKKTPTFTLDTNAYRQDHDTALALGWWLLKMLRVAYPIWQGIGVLFDPRMVVGDKVTLTDPDLSQVQADVLVWGRHCSIDASNTPPTVDMSLDCRPIAPAGAWRLGVHGASELGSTTWLY